MHSFKDDFVLHILHTITSIIRFTLFSCANFCRRNILQFGIMRLSNFLSLQVRGLPLTYFCLSRKVSLISEQHLCCMRLAGMLWATPALSTSSDSAKKLQVFFKHSLLGDELLSFAAFKIIFVSGADSLMIICLPV